MAFAQSIYSVIFANDQADLLVSVCGDIILVSVVDYLPVSYMPLLLEMSIKDDQYELSIPMDMSRKYVRF
jgi:hypothetical protein